LNLKMSLPERFFTALQTAGMPEVPGEFSVVPRQQVIPKSTLEDISKFVRVFDRVISREAWQAAARREAPAIAQLRRPEVCFFSAWDFHLPPEGDYQLIEFNDNGSGFLFAAIMNDVYHRVANLGQEKSIAPPAQCSAFTRRIGGLVEPAVLNHGHLTHPLSLSRMAKYDGDTTDLAQDFNLAANDSQHTAACAALVEKYVPPPEFNSRGHDGLLAANSRVGDGVRASSGQRSVGCSDDDGQWLPV
jgi:hypothetical protein